MRGVQKILFAFLLLFTFVFDTVLASPSEFIHNYLSVFWPSPLSGLIMSLLLLVIIHLVLKHFDRKMHFLFFPLIFLIGFFIFSQLMLSMNILSEKREFSAPQIDLNKLGSAGLENYQIFYVLTDYTPLLKDSRMFVPHVWHLKEYISGMTNKSNIVFYGSDYFLSKYLANLSRSYGYNASWFDITGLNNPDLLSDEVIIFNKRYNLTRVNVDVINNLSSINASIAEHLIFVSPIPNNDQKKFFEKQGVAYYTYSGLDYSSDYFFKDITYSEDFNRAVRNSYLICIDNVSCLFAKQLEFYYNQSDRQIYLYNIISRLNPLQNRNFSNLSQNGAGFAGNTSGKNLSASGITTLNESVSRLIHSMMSNNLTNVTPKTFLEQTILFYDKNNASISRLFGSKKDYVDFAVFRILESNATLDSITIAESDYVKKVRLNLSADTFYKNIDVDSIS